MNIQTSNTLLMKQMTNKKMFIRSFILLLVFCASSIGLYSQGDIACLNHVNFSLDAQSCSGTVTPSMFLVGSETCSEDFVMTITDEFDRVVSHEFDISDVGSEFTYMVCCEDNCCWGTMTVEYKSAASVSCPADDTIQCGTLDFYTFVPPTSSCSDISVSVIDEQKTALDCDSLLTATVSRVYKVEDDFGNVTECRQNIGLERINTGDIIWPESAQISCSDNNLVFNDEGSPLPWYYQSMTGSGTGAGQGQGIGVPLICGVSAPFDYFFPKMLDESSTTTVTYGNGNIGSGLSGDLGSSFFCPGTGSGTGSYPLIPFGGATIIVETGDVDNPDVETIFAKDQSSALFCNTMITYTDFIYPVVGSSCTRKIARTWELSEWWCTDELTTSSLQIIEIKDDAAPEYVCPDDYTVSTTDDCAAQIELPKLNPVDRCGSEVNVKAQYAGGLVDTDGATVGLEIGDNIISFTVSDGCLNSSLCQTTITVVDGTDPVAICERTKVVALSTLNENRVPASVFDDASFDDCGIVKMEARRMEDACHVDDQEWSDYVRFCCEDVVQGEVMVAFRVLDQSGNQSICMVTVEVQDKLVADLTCPSDMTIDCSQGYDVSNLGLTFGIPSFSGTCGNVQIPQEDLTSNLNECGLGTMTRTFKASDAQGNVVNTCDQIIIIENASPFVSGNILWPSDYEQNSGCSIEALYPDRLPEGYGYPVIFEGNGCNLVGFDYTDKIITTNPGSFECAVIERTWTVANWCSVVNGEFETFVIPEPQILKLRNTIVPQLDDNTSLVVDGNDINCDGIEILINRSASDDCGNALIWRYKMISESGAVVAEGTQNTISGTFAAGNYDIEWTVSDGCGNSDSDVQSVFITSNKPPTPVCHNGLSGSLTGTDSNGDGQIDLEQIELWASDFNAGSYPNCNNPITFSFSSDTTDQVVFFDCNHLGIQEVDLWVTDSFSGAQDRCRSFIDIQDSNGLCAGFTVAVVGEIYTEEEQKVERVEVLLDNTTLNALTDDEGAYAFSNMPLGGNYTVSPQLDTDYLNGISTIDLIIIQRHILGIAPLDSPYKLIAADVNDSGSINGIDLVELRKLILGIYTDLPMNTSWRFIAENHVFDSPQNPWLSPITEHYDIVNLSQDISLDFVGVKIGDVNSDAVVNWVNPDAGSVHNQNLEFVMSLESVEANETAVIEVTASNYSDILGWQGTLEFDNENLEIVKVESDGIFIEESNINLNKVSEGQLSISYDSEVNTTMKSDEVLFRIYVTARKALASTDKVMAFGSSLTRAEAYSSSLGKLNVTTGEAEERELEILSVSPNPFINTAELEFYLPHNDKVEFEYFDVNGKLLKANQGYYVTGINKIQLNRDDFNSNGFVYVRMTTGQSITEYRMMLL